MPVFFDGRLWVTPATMSRVDDSAMYNQNLNVGNIVAIVGKSISGQPGVPLRFGSPAEALAAIGAGMSMTAIKKAFDPSDETKGPATVIFLRVNSAIQSSLALNDVSAAPVINLLSADYGAVTNGVRVKVESGSLTGKKVTTQLGKNYYTADNLARNCLSIAYAGTEATATVAVSPALLTLVYGAQTLAIDLSLFPTVSSLADRINAVPGFSAAVLDGNDEKPTLNGLDNLSAVSVKTTAATVTGNLQAIIDWLNSAAQPLVIATRATNAGTLPANVPFTYLTGGSDGTSTTIDWQNAFDALQTVDCQWVSPVSADPAIHAMTDTHCVYMSNVGRMERRAICGGDTGVSDAAAIAAAKALNSDRTSYTHLGIYDYDDNGVLTLFPAYIAAAMMAGAFSGVNPGVALTNKAVKIRGIERSLRNPTDTDPLINGGVLCIENTPSGYKVVKSITTWLVNDNYNRVEQSCGMACDFTSRNVRNALDPLRGQGGSPQILADAVSRTETVLTALAVAQPMGPGVLVGDKLNPPFKNIRAFLTGDVVGVEYQASPVIPVNYITIVTHAVPYSGVATA